MGDRSPPLEELAQAFALGEPRGWQRIGSGHIHETFSLECGGGGFVLQSLNTLVFPDLEALLENTARITDHLRGQLAAAGEGDLDRRVLRLVHTTEGTLSHRTEDGVHWRCTHRIPGAESRDHARGEEDARSAARTFGEFARALDDLSPPPAVTIEGFHDLGARRRQLETAAREDVGARRSNVQGDLDAIFALCDRLLSEHDLGALPVRVVHNDCKLNNVLFAANTDETLCVVDLDTVMEGSLVYDFGELVRTASCEADEDEIDLAKIRIDRSLLAALTRGYVTGLGALLTDAERAALPLAGARLAVENALRFLADHLAGDVYFGADRTGHNLDRHRAQRRLAEGLLDETGVVARALGA